MNQTALFPGTKIPVTGMNLLAGIFSATNGITLSQVCEMTGIEPSTIQNWIKRGYVNPPVGRRYSRHQAARIIIINMLRNTMAIESIAKLLSYVNGNLLDTSDDIMDDSDIYDHLCEIIIPADMSGVVDVDALFQKVDSHLENYCGPRADAKGRLAVALKAIICAYESANLKRMAERLTEGIA